MATNVNGVLLLYHHPEGVNAATIMEHVEAFGKHSRFRVWNYNTDAGFPRALGDYRFGAIVLHYSLFGPLSYRLDDYFLSYLDGTSSYKIAFFQDEHHYCRDRFEFLDRHRIDCVYTLVEPANWPQTYGKYTKVENLVYNMPGYVSDDLVRHAAEIAKPDEEREIDIGYRGRTLLPYMGTGLAGEGAHRHRVPRPRARLGARARHRRRRGQPHLRRRVVPLPRELPRRARRRGRRLDLRRRGRRARSE